MGEERSSVSTTPLDVARKRLKHLLFESNTPTVVALYAGWGQGKTYFWKQEFDKTLNAINPGYVSVFGATSLLEIRERVVVAAASRLVKKSSRPNALGDYLEKLRKLETQLYQRVDQYFRKKIDAPEGVLTQFIEEACVGEGWVLCIDDIERLSPNVKIDTLLGYINELKHERKIKVILIFNRDGLQGNQADAFKQYQEKVIDHQIPFNPNIQDLVELVFLPVISQTEKAKLNLLRELVRRCEVLGLKNIRLLEKSKYYYNDVIGELPGNADPAFCSAVLYSLLLFVWVYYPGPDQVLANLDLLKERTSPYMNWFGEQQNDADEKSKEIAKLLDDYGYTHTDDLDLLLIDYIENNIIDGEKLRALHDSTQERIENERLDREFRSVWKNVYLGSLRNNEAEFCDNLVRAVETYICRISLQDLDKSLRLLSDLDRGSDASKLLELFTEKRAQEFHKDIDIFDYVRYGKLSYTPLNDWFTVTQKEAQRDEREIGEVIAAALGEQYPLDKDRTRLSQFTAQDFVDYFDDADGDNVVGRLRRLVTLANNVANPDDNVLKIREAAKEAATVIAKKNRLNAHRLEGLGLDDI